MDFIDLAAQQRRISDKLNANMARVLAHGQYINGPEVRELEQALAGYVGVKHAVGCASGTDALLMALMALDIGTGDIVFTPPFTFIATAEPISLLGATPVFVDIDPATFNIDPAKLEEAIVAWKGKGRQRAVIPVDLFGLPADYDAIAAVAARHGLTVIEDAAQSFGGVYKGKKTCAFGEIACTSFFPAKPLGCYGDGGMCFTNDDRIDRNPPLDPGPRPGERQVRERPDRDQRTPGHPAGRDPPGQVRHLPGGDRSPPGGRKAIRRAPGRRRHNPRRPRGLPERLGTVLGPRPRRRRARRPDGATQGGRHTHGCLLPETPPPAAGLRPAGL